MNPFPLPLQFEPHALYGSAIDGEPMPFGYISTAAPMPIFELSTPLKWPTDALASLARQMAAAPQMFAALLAAESFISGFEDDDLQEGVSPLLRSIRAIIRPSGAGSVVIVKAQALGKTESLLTIVQETQDPTIYAVTADDWRPIETAPKDGTSILLATAGKPGVDLLEWKGGKRGGWTTECGSFQYGDGIYTHWQPLPTPPVNDMSTEVRETDDPNIKLHVRKDTGQISSISVNYAGAGFAPVRPEASPAENDWRPVETAPKDGTPILARYMWLGEHRYLVVRRSQNGPWWLADHDGLIKHDDDKAKPSNYEFTHWRPITPPTLDGSAINSIGGDHG